MVDPVQLTFDTAALASYLLIPPVLLAGLFLLAWERNLPGGHFGFGKRTFILLLVGGFIGWLANLPFFGWNGSVLMLNVGGGLLPVAVSLVVLDQRLLPGRTRELLLFLLGLLLAVSATVVLLVALPPRLSALRLLGFLASFIGGGALFLLLRSHLGLPGRSLDAAGALALVALGVWGTFLTTQVVEQVGVVSAFPDYLFAPFSIALGAVALRWPRRDGPALAYVATTLGVLLGADILHQPQLFAATVPFLGSIGGAGPLDLVFMSGPFSLGVALGADLLARHWLKPTLGAEGANALPFGPVRGAEARFQEGLQAFADGRVRDVATGVLRTLGRDLAETRAALGLPSAPAAAGLAPLLVHPFVQGDLSNLRELERTGSADPDHARRALVTGFLLQRGLTDILGRRLATLGDRIKAFGIDLVLAFAPSIPILLLVLRFARLSPSDPIDSALSSNLYLGAISALGAWPFAVYALLEWRCGATPGKRLLGIKVVGPDGGRVTPLAAIARNIPKLLPLAALSTTLGIGVAIGAYLRPVGEGILYALGFFAIGLFLSSLVGLVSVWAIRVSPRRRRLGDHMGATMVWRRVPPITPSGERPPAPLPVPSAPLPSAPPALPAAVPGPWAPPPPLPPG